MVFRAPDGRRFAPATAMLAALIFSMICADECGGRSGVRSIHV